MLQKNNTQDPAQTLTELFQADPGRARRWTRRVGPILADLSRRHLHEARFGAMLAQARQAGLPEAVRALFEGGVVNVTENRPALHWALRAPYEEIPGGSLADEWRRTLERMAAIAGRVRSGDWAGAGGEPVTDVICLGIGGSELGARLVVDALGPGDGPRLHWLANADGRRLSALLPRLDPERTLVLVSSKSFGTRETLHNARAVREWLPRGEGAERAHLLAVTAHPDRARDFGVPQENVLPLWREVGGRFSLWSAAGLPIMLAFGEVAFRALGEGAQEMDRHFRDAEPAENLPLLLGALDLERPAMAVVPYDERLRLLPEYLMQLFMESLGKGVTVRGEDAPAFRAPLLLGSTGSRAEHAFFQALHQAHVDVAVEFIGAIAPGHEREADHRSQLAQMLAQSAALAFGIDAEAVREEMAARGHEPEAIERQLAHRVCPGNRPSSVLLLDALDPRSLGGLLALYEHRVFVAGVLAGVNPFDQFGVELGKRLTRQVEPALRGKEGPLPPGLEALVRAIRGQED